MKNWLRLAAAASVMTATAALADTVSIETARGPAEIAAAPEKVAVFAIAALDTLDALGVKPAGVPSKIFVDYLDQAVAGAEPVGTLFEPDFEAVNALQPDLVIVGGRSAKQVDALSGLAPTIDMTLWGDDLVAEAKARLHAYGALFGKQEKAAELEQALDDEIARAKAAAEGKGDALIVLTNGPKISAYGVGSRFGWIYTATGMPSAAGHTEDAAHGEAISFEYIREVDPDWLIVIDRVAAIGAEGAGAKATLDNELVAETKAWKQGHVIYLNAANIYVASGGVQSMKGTLEEITRAVGGGE